MCGTRFARDRGTHRAPGGGVQRPNVGEDELESVRFMTLAVSNDWFPINQKPYDEGMIECASALVSNAPRPDSQTLQLARGTTINKRKGMQRSKKLTKEPFHS
jgi:hypothetical protein